MLAEVLGEPLPSSFGEDQPLASMGLTSLLAVLGREADTAGNPHRAQISQFELFEFMIILLGLDKQWSIE